MDCPFCGSQMEEGEISITDADAGTIYWAPKKYMEKHHIKTMQLPYIIKKGGGVILAHQAVTLYEHLYAYRCLKCKKIIIDY